MNRTGLLILFAAVVALGVGAYWFMTPRTDTAAPKSETLSTTDSGAMPPAADEQTAAAPPADSAAPDAPAEGPPPAEPQQPDATTAPSDQLGGIQATDDERKLRARRESEDKDAKEDEAGRVQGFNQASPPPPPPPPPPPAPVESAPPAMGPTPAPAPVVPPTRTTRGRAAPASEDIPLFPWPVPKASATFEVPRQLIIGNTSAPTFGSVAERIASALDHAGYGERSYYALASGHGIAIATQLEQINDDGTPMIGVARFEDILVAPSREQFSLTSYVKALFSARSGRFRIIVFTLSGGIAEGAKPPSEDNARSWAASGRTRLPQHYALIPFTDRVTCTALIYEFEKKSYADASLVPSGKLNAMSHLMNAGIWTLLGKP